jgi:hypothetical protein
VKYGGYCPVHNQPDLHPSQLKNKPHPRWAQSSPNHEPGKRHSRAETRVVENDFGGPVLSGSNASSSPRFRESSSVGETGLIPSSSSVHTPLAHTPLSRTVLSPCVGDRTLNPNSAPSRNSHYSSPSPLSALSPGIVTPTDELPSSPVIYSSDQHAFNGDSDLVSMSYPNFMSYDTGMFNHEHHPRLEVMTVPQHDEACSATYSREEGGHCGCLSDSSTYNVLLELSLGLRKAADILSRSPDHRSEMCLLHRLITELDAFSTYVCAVTCIY